MLAEKEKAIVEIEKLRNYLPKEKQKKLAQILGFGEKMKSEGEKLRDEFWKGHNKEDFLNLISQYEESKENFERGLSPEEKEILDRLEGKTKEKFYREKLNEIILYSGNPEKISFKNDNNEIRFLREIEDKKGKLKPGMKINLSYREIGDVGVKTIAEMSKDVLRPGMEMDLTHNNIGADGVKYLAETWKNNLQPGMTINLDCNYNIGDDGVEYLAKEWKDRLQPGMTINLEYSRIGEKGAKALAKEWKDRLQPGMVINLRGNHIGDDGVKALAKEWKNSLKPGMTIDLGRDSIGDAGAIALAENWKDRLQPGMKISLKENHIGDDGVQAIKDNLELKDGVALDLMWNEITESKLEELRAWTEPYEKKGINCRVGV